MNKLNQSYIYYVSKIKALSTSIGVPAVTGLLDQAVVSLGNFSIGIYLIRHAPKEEYGYYVLGISGILLLIGLANAVITTQMTVLTASYPIDERKAFCFSLFLAQGALYGLIFLCCGLGTFLLFLFGLIPMSTLILFLVGLLAGGGVLLCEFFRSYFYLELNPTRVLKFDVLRFTIAWALIIAFGNWINHEWHLSVLMDFGIASSIVGIISLRVSEIIIPLCPLSIKQNMKKAWAQGQWALGGVILIWLQNNGYQYIWNIFLGPTGVAEANAGRLLLSPTVLLHQSFQHVILPHLIILRDRGELLRLFLIAKIGLFLILGIIFSYGIVLGLSKDWISQTIYSGKYSNVELVIAAWFVFFLVSTFRSNSTLLLKAFMEFKTLTLLNIASVILVLIGTIIFIPMYGILGGILILALGEIVYLLLLAPKLRRIRTNS